MGKAKHITAERIIGSSRNHDMQAMHACINITYSYTYIGIAISITIYIAIYWLSSLYNNSYFSACTYMHVHTASINQ